MPWEKYKEKHGVAVERRAERVFLYEYRAVSTMPMAPAALIELMWNNGADAHGSGCQEAAGSTKEQGPASFTIKSRRRLFRIVTTMRLRTQALGNDRYEMTFPDCQ